MVLVHASEITPRLEYTFRLVFEDILRIKVLFTSSVSDYSTSVLPKIDYSQQPIGQGLFLKPAGLLFQTGPNYEFIETVVFEGERYFFESSPDSFLPFDPFAAAFFLVSRMEEYSGSDTDQYGRFRHENSILFRNGLLRKPVVNSWALLVADKLKEKYPELVVPEPSFNFIPTIDIDCAWSYRNKGLLRNLGGFFRDLSQFQGKEALERLWVLFKLKKDPFDTYEFLEKSFSGKESKVVFFFLLGNHSRFDKNIPFNNREFRLLIKRISGKYSAGIHPSLQGSRDNSRKWTEIEKLRLEEIIGEKVTCSRQHFLNLKFPETYHTLIDSGILADYTMGYPGECGFRAGISTPYRFYNVVNEQVTDLTIYPFQVMDVTLKDYLGLSPEQAIETIESLMSEVKKSGGTFISLWHNETLTNTGKWKGYREVFSKMVQTGFTWSND